MDGTVVDTEPYWISAEFALAEEYGGSWSQRQALELVGHDLLTSARHMREHMGIDLEPSDIVEFLLDRVTRDVQHQVPWRPGAVELLAELRQHGIPCALVTMSYLTFVTPILAALPAETFAEVITGDAVSQGKPHPEPYLKAAHGLGVHPSRCLAIEDTHTGARSAVAAGCDTVLVVPHHVPVVEGDRRVFADRLAGLSVATLPGPWNGAPGS
jgi:HAD superfamily hydrolase (TIGR01509 family)